MAKVYQIEKANPRYKGDVVEDVEIRIHKSIDFDKEEDPTDTFYHDAEELFDALRVLPGGTFDRLLMLMLRKAASSFVVPHDFHEKERAAPDLLEACKEALEEAKERGEDLGYNCWPKIRAAIAKAEGKEAKNV